MAVREGGTSDGGPDQPDGHEHPPTPFAELETDPRFPSGGWIGFFLQPGIPGRHWMELELAFRGGKIEGAGRDWVGPFAMTGRYELETGICTITKQYVNRHAVYYRGFGEGRGIWGTWELPRESKGGFHIWPVSLPDPTGSHLHESADVPADPIGVAQ